MGAQGGRVLRRRVAFVLLLFLCGLLLLSPAAGSKSEQKQLILNNIFGSGYSRTIPPHEEDDSAVKVETGITPVHISIDENQGVLHTHAWFAMRWYDNRLKWDSSQYEGVSLVHTSPWRVWRPDFKAYNGVDQNYYMTTDCLLYSSGLVFWIPPVTFKTACDMDYSYWPWDVQVCRIVIGSWTKSGDDIDILTSLDDPNRNASTIYTAYYREKLWEIVWSQAVISRVVYYGTTFYPDYTATFKLRRASWVDRKVVVLPIILAACLTLATFWTHPLSKSRLHLGTTNLILLVLLLLFLRSRLPMAGGQLPLIVSFAGAMSVLVTVQLLASLAVANLVARRDEPPFKMVEPLHGVMGKVLCLSNLPLLGQIPNPNSFIVDMDALKIGPASSALSAATPAATPTAGEGGASDGNSGGGGGGLKDEPERMTGWNLLAQALDRLLFAVYLVIILVFIATFFGGAAANDTV